MKTSNKNKTSFSTICVVSLFAGFIQNTAFSADLADQDIIGFSPNTPVTAGDFNTNFDNVKNAINTKQDKIINSCDPGESIRIINPDGSVQCEIDDDNGISDIEIGAGSFLSKSGTTNIPKLDVVGMPGIAVLQSQPLINLSNNYQTVATLAVSTPATGYLSVSLDRSASACGDDYAGQLRSPEIYLQKTGLNTVNAPVGAREYVFPISQTDVSVSVLARCVPPGGFATVDGTITINSLKVVYFPISIAVP